MTSSIINKNIQLQEIDLQKIIQLQAALLSDLKHSRNKVSFIKIIPEHMSVA